MKHTFLIGLSVTITTLAACSSESGSVTVIPFEPVPEGTGTSAVESSLTRGVIVSDLALEPGLSISQTDNFLIEWGPSQ